MFKKFLIVIFVLGLLASVAAGLFLTWGYYYITRDMPQLSTIKDYRPAAVSTVYARDGTVIGEFFGDERRYPAKLNEVPLYVRQAFMAAEDASFYQHQGIDPISILRAFVTNLREGQAKQGGSTITQQVVKNLLLSPEKKIQRKIKEAILSYQLEKRFTKDEIFEIYLNQIFFGNYAYGIKAAARFYFHKELGELSIAEGAILAGLPKAPSKFSPILHPERAKRRQRYVIAQMVKHGFITSTQGDQALRERIQVYPATSQNIFHAPYYVSEVRHILNDKWRDLDPDTDGLQIYTAVDLKADEFATKDLQKGLREVDKRRGWRGPIGKIADLDHAQFLARFAPPSAEEVQTDTVYPALVLSVSAQSGLVTVDLGYEKAQINLHEASWAKKRRDREDQVSFKPPEADLGAGDVVEVLAEQVPLAANGKRAKSAAETVRYEKHLELDQTPDIEGAINLIDPFSGEVYATVGGYSYQRSQFNRATQGLRQPGSAFKPIVYLTAVDQFNFTPATIVYDQPRTFRVGDQFWTPANFDEKFMGPITLRVALEKSRNLVSADIVSRIGVDPIIQYAKKMGIESKIGRNLSIALGSSEVIPLELARAYGVFAAKGVLFDSVFITKIVSRDGQVLYDYDSEKLSKAKQVISENTAFIMANLMKGVVEHGTGVRVRELGRPVAGKTGTSNDEMDAWFIGYTPKWVCGIWVGFDQKKTIGDKETGGRVSAPIFVSLMGDFLKYKEAQDYDKLVQDAKAEAQRLGIEYVPPEPVDNLDFSVPDGVDPFWIYKESGAPAPADAPGAILEYFIKGTEPSGGEAGEANSAYLDSPEL